MAIYDIMSTFKRFFPDSTQLEDTRNLLNNLLNDEFYSPHIEGDLLKNQMIFVSDGVFFRSLYNLRFRESCNMSIYEEKKERVCHWDSDFKFEFPEEFKSTFLLALTNLDTNSQFSYGGKITSLGFITSLDVKEKLEGVLEKFQESDFGFKGMINNKTVNIYLPPKKEIKGFTDTNTRYSLN
jgi:hypothetical protein